MKVKSESNKKSYAPIPGKKCFRRQMPYFVMLALPMLYFAVFKYLPMVGLAMAFQNYKTGAAFIGFDAQWVGLQWFRQLFQNPFFGRLVRNTLLLSISYLTCSFPLSIFLALLLNEIRKSWLRRFTANITLLPYFISTVVIVGVMFNFFSVDGGLVNNVIKNMGGNTIDFMGSYQYFRSLYVGSGIWQNVGFDAVVFTAAIAGIDPTYYEAAALDGSTRFKNILYITLPCITPTIITMLLLRLGSLMSVGYEKIILMYSPAIYETADVLSTYAYRAGILDRKVSLATAIGLINSVVNLVLLLAANRFSRKVSETSLW